LINYCYLSIPVTPKYNFIIIKMLPMHKLNIHYEPSALKTIFPKTEIIFINLNFTHMKKALLSFFTGIALLLTVAASAQNVAVNATGATADPSAILDVNATNAGLLVPRINLASLTDAATIANPTTSLLVYNTNAALGTGYYYNSGTPAAPVWTSLGGAVTSQLWDTTASVLYNVPQKQVSIGNTYLSPYSTLLYLENTTGDYSGTMMTNTVGGDSVFADVDANTSGFNGMEIGTFTHHGTYFFNGGYYYESISPLGNFGVGALGSAYDTALARLQVKNIDAGYNKFEDISGDPRATGFAVTALPTFSPTIPRATMGAYVYADQGVQQNIGVLVATGTTAKPGNFYGGYNYGVIGEITAAPVKKSSGSIAMFAEDEINTSATSAFIAIGRAGINTLPAAQLDVLDEDAVNTWASPTGSITGGFTASSAVNEAFTAGTGAFNIGSYGFADDGDVNASVLGESGESAAAGFINVGVWGFVDEVPANSTSESYGVYGADFVDSANTFAGRFNGHVIVEGDVDITGNLSKGGGTFKIDDPTDPANKYLYHSFVESPDMMNVYNGNATTDASGNATVKLPSYFQAENIDFKYQLTVIGQFAQAIVGSEVSNNTFTIKTDKPNVKVSWQVTGVRNDKWAQAHRVVPEVEKETANKGKYLYPELYGQPKSAGITHAKMPLLTGASKAKAVQSQQSKSAAVQGLKTKALNPGSASQPDDANSAQQKPLQAKHAATPKK
jgi:hypothetical protein